MSIIPLFILQLKNFSMQFVLRKLKFIVNGIFPIDFTLVNLVRNCYINLEFKVIVKYSYSIMHKKYFMTTWCDLWNCSARLVLINKPAGLLLVNTTQAEILISKRSAYSIFKTISSNGTGYCRLIIYIKPRASLSYWWIASGGVVNAPWDIVNSCYRSSPVLRGQHYQGVPRVVTCGGVKIVHISDSTYTLWWCH